MKHIIISRTDNIGDVILTLPLAGIIKKEYPGIKISFLSRNYVKPIIKNCSSIDEFISWDILNDLSKKEAAAYLKETGADTILHVFPQKKIACIARIAKITNRIGTSRRWYHYLTCNKKIKFSRKNSKIHEARLNLNLLTALNIKTEYSLKELSKYINLQCKENSPEKLHSYLNKDKFNLIIHPLSNGNCREWPIENFNSLIKSLPTSKFNILITGTKAEGEKLKSQLLDQCPQAINLTGKLSLDELLILINSSDGLIANSTGPLHMAAALGIKTLGIFVPEKSMSPNRWGPIGKQSQFIVTNKICNAKICRNAPCPCLEDIRIADVKSIIMSWL